MQMNSAMFSINLHHFSFWRKKQCICTSNG